MASAQPPSSNAKRLSLRPEWRDNRLSLVASIKDTPAASDATRSPAMDIQSPLTQQTRPEVFEPKIATLYRQLFRDVEDVEHDQGFWAEMFLLKPDIPRLRQILEDTEADFLLHVPHQPQQLVLQATSQIRAGKGPSDENALDTLTVFFSVVLAKKYTNPSADIIEVVAGLDHVDSVFSELVAALEHATKDGRNVSVRQKAVRAAIAVISGGYQTALVSYFLQKDFFPALMKLIQALDSPLQAAEPFVLTGLLVNYDKFESHNQYRVRLADFVNDEAMTRVVESIGWTFVLLRERYIAIQDDTPTGWTLGGTLSYVGLGALTGTKPAAPVLTEDEQKQLFGEQPGSQAAILLSLYDFVQANKVFCQSFITTPGNDKDHPPAFSVFLSFASYLFQHAFRTVRASWYAYLTSLMFLILVEDQATAKLLCETSAAVRLCRQRPPHLPLPKGERTYAAALLDVLVDGINHNLRKRLDTAFYQQNVTVLSKLLQYLSKSRTKLPYHWSELWRTLLSLIRFLTTYADDLKSLHGTSSLVQSVVDLLTLALTNGETFLPDSASYDDLFYKLVESGEALVKFREAYALGKPEDPGSSITTLVGVSKHYQELIEEHHKRQGSVLSPREVSNIIKKGYDTLSIEAREGLDHSQGFREADHKTELKRIARIVVGDAALLVA